MKKIIFGLLIATSLTSQALFACTEGFKEELEEIRTNFAPRIRQLNDKDSTGIFNLTKDLSQRYKGLAAKICAEVMERHPGIEEIVSIALSGSVAWGEPTLKSDIEVVYLVRDYTNIKQVFDFALDFADEIEKMGDKHFTLDQVSSRELQADKMSILERAPAVFTIADIEKFNFRKLSPQKTEVKEFVQHFSELMETAEDKNALLSREVIDEVSGKLCGDPINFSHSLFNLEPLGGDEELFESYNIHFQSLVKGMVGTYVDGQLSAKERSECLGFKCGYYGSSSILEDALTKFMNVRYSNESFNDDYIKFSWRCVSNVVRGLGFSFGANNEKGTLNTLNTLKSIVLEGTKGTWTPPLGEASYGDLLHKATVLTWARLVDSTLDESDSREDITAKLKNLCELRKIADFGNTYYQKYYGFLHGIDAAI